MAGERRQADVETAPAATYSAGDATADRNSLLRGSTAHRAGGYGTTDGSSHSRYGGHTTPVESSEEPESTAARACRIAEPVLTWTVCTAIAALACLHLFSVTKLPHFPASLPEAFDGRTLQVGYIANSSDAHDAFVGCVRSADPDGAYLRDDVGASRFPDFIIAGMRGGPYDELRKLIDEKNLACVAAEPDNDFFTDPRWRAAPIPLESQKEFVVAQYDRCGGADKFLGVPRFQTSRDALYAGWTPKRMCEVMGAKETRVVTLLPDPIDHALAVFAQVLESSKGKFNTWFVRGNQTNGGGGGRGGSVASTGEAAPAPANAAARSRSAATATAAPTTGAAAAAAAWIPYDVSGFAKVVEVDVAVANKCGADLLLPVDDPNFEAARTCCAQVAAALGYTSWPGCRDCNPALARADGSACAAAGELAFSPVRAGIYANSLKRLYRYVLPANVLVVTADQALASGMATLAVAVTSWRLLGLPLVDPASVTQDLLQGAAQVGVMTQTGAEARSAAGVGLDAAARFGQRRAASASEDGVEVARSGGGVDSSAAAATAAAAVAARGQGGGSASITGSDGGAGGAQDGGSTWMRFERILTAIIAQVGAKGFAGWGWKGSEYNAATRKRLEEDHTQAEVEPEAVKKGSGDDGDAVSSVGQSPGVSSAGSLPRGFNLVDIPDELRAELQEFYTPHVEALNALIGNGRILWWGHDGSRVQALQERTMYTHHAPPPPSSQGPGAFVVDAANFAPASTLEATGKIS